MRSFLILLLIVVYLIVTLPVVLVLSLIRRKDEKKAERGARVCLCWVFKWINRLAGVHLTVKGLEKVPTDRPVLYISNHRSFFDIAVTYPNCALPTSYIAKSQVQNIPFFGTWGKLIRALFFDRDDIKASVKMILDGVARLKDDTSVYIFPEGTRNKAKEQLPLLPFRDGSFKLASKSGAPVIPVAITGTAEIWEAHKPWVHSGKVTVTYGDPIYIRDLSKEDQKNIGAYMKHVMEALLEQDLKN